MESLIPASLRRNRNARRQSLDVIAGLANMSPQHLSKIESGNVDIRLSSIERVANALGLTLMLVPRDKAPEIRRYLATDGRAYRTVSSGDQENV